jgi:hypothetical protein
MWLALLSSGEEPKSIIDSMSDEEARLVTKILDDLMDQPNEAIAKRILQELKKHKKANLN